MKKTVSVKLQRSHQNESNEERLKSLKEQFNHSVSSEFVQHTHTIRHQFRAYKHLKETTCVNEAVIHIDFSENYICHNAAEIQSAYFGASNRQATLHTGVLYKIDGIKSFATISDSLRHDPSVIWAHLRPILNDIRKTNPEILSPFLF